MFNELELPTSTNIKFTPEGGLAIRLINKTGANSIKGYCVDSSHTLNNAFIYVPNGTPDCIGVIYNDGIANSLPCWVVVSGIADVYYSNTVTAGQFARTQETASAAIAGKAYGEDIPAPPFATDKHFQEIGHILESGDPGLHKTVLHFN